MDDEPLNAHPVFEFNRPHLYLGGDRELVLLSLLLSIVLIVILQNFYTAIIGIAVAFASVYGLRILAKADPQMRDVYLRYRRYQSYYPAHGTKNRR
ncbi:MULTISPECIES: conjugal transfer protein TrbD [Photobacterium]|uniref:conjugal transfer protein TrbD n=1 Tax=Photobacterium TaxID=657 RepID=UPI0027381EBE|nr:conjugal transfer protein TrbD [Photobacterium leiognathi]